MDVMDVVGYINGRYIDRRYQYDDGQPKFVDGLPFNITCIPKGQLDEWRGRDGYCPTVSQVSGHAYVHGMLTPLWLAEVPANYAGVCLGAGYSIDETIQMWLEGFPADYLTAVFGDSEVVSA